MQRFAERARMEVRKARRYFGKVATEVGQTPRGGGHGNVISRGSRKTSGARTLNSLNAHLAELPV